MAVQAPERSLFLTWVQTTEVSPVSTAPQSQSACLDSYSLYDYWHELSFAVCHYAVKPMTLVLLVSCSNHWALGKSSFIWVYSSLFQATCYGLPHPILSSHILTIVCLWAFFLLCFNNTIQNHCGNECKNYSLVWMHVDLS